MTYVLQILILFILINSLLKLSFWRLWQVCLFALTAALFVVGTGSWATTQSKTRLVEWLSTPAVMQNVAVWITLETTLCIAFCFVELRADHAVRRPSPGQRLLRLYPGLLLFPMLLYVQTQLIFTLPGADFDRLSYLLAGGVLVGLPLLSRLPAWLTPEKEFRLELHFLVSLFVCIIGLITTVNGSVVYKPVPQTVNLRAILLAAALFVLFFGSGLVWNKLKWNLKQKSNGTHL